MWIGFESNGLKEDYMIATITSLHCLMAGVLAISLKNIICCRNFSVWSLWDFATILSVVQCFSSLTSRQC